MPRSSFRHLSFLVITFLALAATLSAASSGFIAPPIYTVGVTPAGIAVGDFNGDGKPDLVVSNDGSSNIAVLINNGDGTFKAPVTYTTPQANHPYAAVVADLNGDGKLDIVSVGDGCCGGQVVVFLGNGDGTFQAGVLYLVGGQNGSSLVVADMNGDGKLDLVVPSTDNAGTGKSVVCVLLGNGDGTFQSPLTTNLTYFAGVYDTLAAGDFNKDSKTDIALVADGQLLLLLGNGDGTFQAPVNLALEGLAGIAAADMNNDGSLDLVALGFGPLSILLGNGDGTFQAPVSISVPVGGSESITLADLNGDGKLDVVIAGAGPSALQVLFGDGTASLGSPVIYAIGSGPAYAHATVAADFNGDGFPDVICSNDLDGTVSVLFGSRTGALQSSVVAQALAGPLVTGDFNGDGKLDVASSFQAQNDFYLFLGDGNGVLQAPAAFRVGGGTYSLIAADFNGDGKLDVATANQANVSVAQGNGDGTFQPVVNYGSSSNLGNTNSYILAPDVNGDGKPDLAVITRPTGSLANIGIMLNSGNGTFLPAVQYALAGSAESVAFADFNGDGKLDMATIDLNGSFPLGVFLGNGDGTFQPRTDYSFGLYCSQVIAADVNGDGKPDLIFACGYLAVSLGNGDGTFQPPILTLLGYASQIAATDFNGDGKLDILAGGKDFGIYYGNGDGTFSYTNYGLHAANVAVGNFNGDNAPDVVIDNGVGAFVLLNTGGTSDELISKPNPSTLKQPVTFRASLSATVAGSPGGTPTGSVTFRDGNTKLATIRLHNGIAVYTTSTLSQGTHRITATYSGDTNFNRNTSQPLYQKVQP